jgi:hypothetical protein
MAVSQFTTTPLSTNPTNFAERMDVRILEQERLVTELNAEVTQFNASLALVKTINRGQWVTGTTYSATSREIFSNAGTWYIALQNHTSGVLATDITSGKVGVYDAIGRGEFSAATGASLIGYLPLATGSLPSFVHNTLRRLEQIAYGEEYSVASFLPANYVRDSSVDYTANFQAAFDAFISLGNANKKGQSLIIPSGDFQVNNLKLGFVAGGGGSAATRDVYHKNIVCHGKLIGTNATGAIVEIEGMSACNIHNLRVKNLSSAVGSIAVKATRSYAVNWVNPKFEGGEVAHVLQGNNNNYFGGGLTNSGVGFGMYGNMSNCTNNTFYSVDFEQNTKWNVEVIRTSGSQPGVSLIGCYQENTPTSLGCMHFFNVFDFEVRDNYIGLNYSCDVLVIGGTLVTSMYGILSVRNISKFVDNTILINGAGVKTNILAMEAGTNQLAMRYLQYDNIFLAGNTSVDTVLGVTGAYAGAANLGAVHAINLSGRRKKVNVTNADFSTLAGGVGTAPTGWVNSNGAAPTSTTTISEYGGGNALVKADGYASQDIKVKQNTLYYCTVYAAVDAVTSVAEMQIWDVGITSKKLSTTATSSLSTVLLEGWFFNTTDTTLKVLLRDTSSGAGNVIFSEVSIIDYTS